MVTPSGWLYQLRDAPGNWLNIMGCSAGLFQNGVLFPKTLDGLSALNVCKTTIVLNIFHRNGCFH
jgi:hypothetical protein